MLCFRVGCVDFFGPCVGFWETVSSSVRCFSRGDGARLGGSGQASGEGGERGSDCLRVSVCSHSWAGAGVAWAASPRTCGPCGALCNFRGTLGNVCRPQAVSCLYSAGVRVWEAGVRAWKLRGLGNCGESLRPGRGSGRSCSHPHTRRVRRLTMFGHTTHTRA